MAGIFKAYDIRGIYGDTLTEDIAFDIGRAIVTFLKCRKVAVAKDIRPHSTPLMDALARGITTQGADVIDLGLASTPICYFGIGSLKADAGVMITASHNPKEWNGFKLTRDKAIPISGATGIMDIEKIFLNKTFDKPADKPGTISKHDAFIGYRDNVLKLADMKKRVKIAADMANAMGAMETKVLRSVMDVDGLYEDLDGSFPNHEANPLKTETLTNLQKKVKEGSYDFGVAFDGDADRAGFLDEKGGIIPMDIISALVARDILAKQKGVILYDLRSSWAVKEIIEENHGTPMMSRVGHAFIKQQMRDNNAVFAGELSGHYYFRENYFTESSAMAVLCVANIVSKSDQPLSELVKPIIRYHTSGEINSKVTDTSAVLERLKTKYSDGHLLELDGISVEYDDWWFNVRSSNTEPLIRLNLEAKTKTTMEEKRDELLSVIRS